MRAQLKSIERVEERSYMWSTSGSTYALRVEFHDNGESFRGRYNHTNVKCNNIEERIVDFASQVFAFRE